MKSEIDDWKNVEVKVNGLIAEIEAHIKGWYESGDEFGFGFEPPDGNEEICEVIINRAYKEDTEEEVKITDDLRKLIEIECVNYL